MDEIQLFAVSNAVVQPLTIPSGATSFDDLYDGLSLGVYSALRTYNHNKFLFLEAHLERTKRSIAMLGWDFDFDEFGLRKALHDICTAYPGSDARVRYDVLAEPAWQFGVDSNVLIALIPFKPILDRVYEEGVAVGFAPGLSRERPLVKAADFAIKRRDFMASRKGKNPYEYLILDNGGHILEGTGSNFYGIKDGVVYTAGKGVLDGITRKVILSLLPDLKIPLRLQAIHKREIETLDEAAISSSSRALLPVVKIGGRVVGNGRPGPLSQIILKAYNQFVAKSVKTAVES